MIKKFIPAIVSSVLAGSAASYLIHKPKVFAKEDIINSKKPQIIEDAILTFAPNVPPPITRREPATVRVTLSTDSAVMPLSRMFKYTFWRFNKHTPGPFIRARVGDTLDLTITNDDETLMPHNIDLHAVSGPGGGSNVTLVDYKQTKKASFKLMYPGLFMYHCATAPIPLHIANGMYGLILVEPEAGLPRVDKEYYVLQSEFYLDQPEDRSSSTIAEMSYSQGLREEPDLVVFNGREGALTDTTVLTAKVGETVRIYFGNAGPNLISSFHVIGTVFNNVYREGDLISQPAKHVQTTLVPAGGAVVVEMTPLFPGTYTLIDHSIFRTEKGAVGFLNVSGERDEAIYYSSHPAELCEGCKMHP